MLPVLRVEVLAFFGDRADCGELRFGPRKRLSTMEAVCIGAGMRRTWTILVASADGSFAVLTTGNCFRSTDLAEVLILACVTRIIVSDMAIQADLLNVVAVRKVISGGGHHPQIISELSQC